VRYLEYQLARVEKIDQNPRKMVFLALVKTCLITIALILVADAVAGAILLATGFGFSLTLKLMVGLAAGVGAVICIRYEAHILKLGE